ncbi:hypothetical protein M8J76_010180 [Diaphorina citri]|nr:hypothetical protein M8J76_010180 [Diaphorina citri]KAI5714572.1 hypothetical protein M8J77_001863 [Diaphorina citri]
MLVRYRYEIRYNCLCECKKAISKPRRGVVVRCAKKRKQTEAESSCQGEQRCLDLSTKRVPIIWIAVNFPDVLPMSRRTHDLSKLSILDLSSDRNVCQT